VSKSYAIARYRPAGGRERIRPDVRARRPGSSKWRPGARKIGRYGGVTAEFRDFPWEGLFGPRGIVVAVIAALSTTPATGLGALPNARPIHFGRRIPTWQRR